MTIPILRGVNLSVVTRRFFINKNTMNGGGKQAAAIAAVNEYTRTNMSVGIGSGTTIIYAINHLTSLLKDGVISNIKCVPTSFQSRQLLNENSIPVCELEQCPVLDIAFDGADELDSSLNCIKGGGGCHLQEKCVASCAKKFIVIADDRKRSSYLGQHWTKGVPLEVLPLAFYPIKGKIESQFGGKAVLRMAKSKAGPMVTDNGNFILDWQFLPKASQDTAYWQDINTKLMMIPGVLETGLFVGMTEKAFIGSSNGGVITLSNKS